MDQLSIYVARGLLIESKHATWLYGTSSEHCVFYRYNFHNSRHVFAGMLQTEPPYFQPTPKAPEPYRGQVGSLPGDPDYSCKGDDFDGCDTAWAVIITYSENVMIGAAGTYSWFDTYTQDCIGKHACQKALWLLSHNYDNVRIQHLVTIGSKYMLVSDGQCVLATVNLAVEGHPRWSHISSYHVQSHGKQSADDRGGEDSKCDASDSNYRAGDSHKGEYYPNPPSYAPWEWNDAIERSKIYVTIVNLTPYTFKLDRTASYQMDAMDFADIPPGHARQNVMDYNGGKGGRNPVDDKGEAYYTIAETGKTFVVMARTHIPAVHPMRPKIELSGFGVGVREYEDRGARGP